VPPLPTDLFDYALPPELVAQTPAVQRDRSRLLVVDRAAHSVGHHFFDDLPQFLRRDDILLRNNAAVLPARLHARRPTGGHVECFLLRPAATPDVWECLVKPGKKLPIGATFTHSSGAFRGEIVAKEADGSAFVRLMTPNGEAITSVANRLGDVPLPPYIERKKDRSPQDSVQRARDLERYQTVYADRARQVAVAAPTAGLHFTPELLARLGAAGVRTADVTLHVGLGTFQPIATASIEEHPIHRELYEIPAATQQALFPPCSRGPQTPESGTGVGGPPATTCPGRRVAVGTTTVRTVEDFLSTHDAPTAHAHVAEAGIFIYPPRMFRGVDALITNFHQPRSTLLCLVAAFLAPGSTEGIPWLKEIYADAIAREYRFFSYGDAMLIL